MDQRRFDDEGENKVEGEITGPLAVFQECIEEPVRVGILFKESQHNQRRMTGWVAGFDGRWNFLMNDVVEVWFQKRNVKTRNIIRKRRERRIGRLYLNGDTIQTVVMDPPEDFMIIKDSLPVKKVQKVEPVNDGMQESDVIQDNVMKENVMQENVMQENVTQEGDSMQEGNLMQETSLMQDNDMPKTP